MNKIRFLSAIILISFSVNAFAQEEKKMLRLAVGESQMVNASYSVARVAVGDPNIADVKVISGNDILVNGKGIGTTTLLIFDERIKREEYLIQVVRSILPTPIIQLSVQIVEVKVDALKKLGINWVNMLSFGEESIPAVFDVGKAVRFTKLTADLNLLIKQGDAHILAKPNLVAMNNGKASFWVGGEIPFLVPGGQNNSPTVDWKKYGVRLEISPSGDQKKNIIVTGIRTEVSNLDYANGVKLDNYVIPATTIREASTEIQLDAGSTVVIAGLKQTSETKLVHKLFILGDIPLLGYLFRSYDKTKQETEVTVFITPTFIGTTPK